MRELVLGTRGSRLALWQAEWVAARVSGVRVEVVKTEGDRRRDANLATDFEPGAFTKELERALLDERIDLAVHSLKDLPTTLPDGLALAAVPERAAAGDVLLVRPDAVDEKRALPLVEGARVGTGSPRRLALLAHARPDTRAPELYRGNVPTRIRRCVEGEVEAVVLARAGLERLALDPSPLVAFDLRPERFVPAPAQGALGLEVRAGDEEALSRLASVACPASTATTGTERALLAALEAGCHAALGAWVTPVADGEVRLCAGARMAADGRWRAVDLRGAPEAVVAEASAALVDGPEASPEGEWAVPAPRWWR